MNQMCMNEVIRKGSEGSPKEKFNMNRPYQGAVGQDKSALIQFVAHFLQLSVILLAFICFLFFARC